MKNLPYTEYFKDAQRDRIATKVLYRIIFVMIFIIVLFLSVTYAFEQKYSYITIGGRSMQTTLNPQPVEVTIVSNGKAEKEWVQDGVYIEETKNIDYGDIIIISKSEDEKTVIKRALAFGGDWVSIIKVQTEDGEHFRLLRQKTGQAEVEIVEEEYVYNQSLWDDEWHMPQELLTPTIIYESNMYSTFQYKNYQSNIVYVEEIDKHVKMFQVPENEVFYLGDHRSDSKDSKQDGCISMEKVRGKVVRIVRNGTYFQGNEFYFIYRFYNYLSIIWDEILSFFGANI